MQSIYMEKHVTHTRVRAWIHAHSLFFLSLLKKSKRPCVCVLPPATGFDGHQALGVQLLQLGRRRRQVIHGEPLPLSSKAHLSWLGFTAEGERPSARSPLAGTSYRTG